MHKKLRHTEKKLSFLRKFIALMVSVSAICGLYVFSDHERSSALFRSMGENADFVYSMLRFELGGTYGSSDLLEALPWQSALLSESSILKANSRAVSDFLKKQKIADENPDLPSVKPTRNPVVSILESSTPPSGLNFESPGVVSRTFIPVSTQNYDYSGGVYVYNRTTQNVNVSELLSSPISVKLQDEKPEVLIIHTHGSEAYFPADDDIYTPSDPSRTEDRNYNVVRVGDELQAVLESGGISVIHDRSLYDFPSYNGSYSRSLMAVEDYLKKYPSIKIVFDIHRDALVGSDGMIYKAVTSIEGEDTAQIMMVVGSNDSGLEHPNWKENLSFATHLQSRLNEIHPNLARPISLRTSRYNQQVSTGSLLLEVGTHGNTLKEALCGVRRFGEVLVTFLNDLK